MIIIDVKQHGNIERALKALKSKVIKTRMIRELQQRKEYTKKSVKRRNEKQNAITKQKFSDY